MAEAEDTPYDLASLRRVADAELAERVRILGTSERGATAVLVAHLAELATRDLYLRAGYSSLFEYCRHSLALSEADVYLRIVAARTARRFPVVLELIEEGVVHLAGLRLLAPYLTSENHLFVLESARGRRRVELEEMVASLAPFPESPDFLRKLPAASATPATVQGVATAPSGAPATPAFVSGPTFRHVPACVVTPLAPDRYKLQVTMGSTTVEKLRLAKDMLRHAVPSGDDAVILDRALTALLAELARTRFAATTRPGVSRGTTADSRHIPAEVKRAVWLRDLGRCAFVGTGGRRCNERAFVEFHHVRPYAAGGEATADNIELRCRSHNGYESRVFFEASREEPPECAESARLQGPAGGRLDARAAGPAAERERPVAGMDVPAAQGVAGSCGPPASAASRGAASG